MKVSYSQIRLFEQCPYLYKLHYIDRVSFPKNAEAEFGKLLHEVLRYYYEKPLSPPSFGQLINFLHKQWTKSDLTQILADPSASKTYLREAELILDEYYKTHKKETVRPIAVEKSFCLKITDPTSGNAHFITGRLDRIDTNKKNQLQVIDYKTSKQLATQKAVEQNKQLALYHWAVSHLWPSLAKNKPVNVTLYYLKHGQALTAIYTQQELEKTEAWLINSIRKIEEAIHNDNFPPKDSPLCASASYRNFCPFYKHDTLSKKPKIGKDLSTEKVVKRYFEIKKTQTQLNQELKNLQLLINEYLDKQKLEAIWGKEGAVARTAIKRYRYEFDKLEPILKKIGQWENILEPSLVKLKTLLKQAPPQLKSAIEKTKKQISQTYSFRTKKR